MSPRTRVTLVPLGDRAAFDERCLFAATREPDLRLGELLAELPALSVQPVPPELLDIRVARLNIDLADPAPDRALYWPPGVAVRSGVVAAPAPVAVEPESVPASGGGVRAVDAHPETIDEATAVLVAHDEDISKAAAYLDSGLSVVVRCDKLLVEHLSAEIAKRSGRRGVSCGSPRPVARATRWASRVAAASSSSPSCRMPSRARTRGWTLSSCPTWICWRAAVTPGSASRPAS
ncbi:hypothetical protein K7G98_03630 [Saccharothrix sp. MB29]|nr:hypothetical protein [Saccharothrix sp. MB29]